MAAVLHLGKFKLPTYHI